MDFTIFNRVFHFFSEEKQWLKLAKYLRYTLENPYLMSAIFLTVALFLFMLLTIFVKGRKKRIINWGLFTGYVIALFLFLVIGKETSQRKIVLDQAQKYLKGELYYHESQVLADLLEVFLFIPAGFLLRKASGRGHFFRNILILLFLSVSIEAMQYIFRKGVSDWMDLVSYMIGGLLGIMIMLPFSRRPTKYQPSSIYDENA